MQQSYLSVENKPGTIGRSNNQPGVKHNCKLSWKSSYGTFDMKHSWQFKFSLKFHPSLGQQNGLVRFHIHQSAFGGKFQAKNSHEVLWKFHKKKRFYLRMKFHNNSCYFLFIFHHLWGKFTAKRGWSLYIHTIKQNCWNFTAQKRIKLHEISWTNTMKFHNEILWQPCLRVVWDMGGTRGRSSV